jgi:hypothetical protein
MTPDTAEFIYELVERTILVDPLQQVAWGEASGERDDVGRLPKLVLASPGPADLGIERLAPIAGVDADRA